MPVKYKSLCARLRNKTVARPFIVRLKNDLLKHLESQGATVENYHGGYGKKVMQVAMEEYPHIFDKDEIDRLIDRNNFTLINLVRERVIDNDKSYVTSEMLRLLLNLSRNQDEAVKQQPVVLSFYKQTQPEEMLLEQADLLEQEELSNEILEEND